MQDYKQAAKDFIENEKQFHLGPIPTEQSNPLTRGLSGRIKKDTADGVKMILDADDARFEDIVAKAAAAIRKVDPDCRLIVK